jgi:hypothetical protein
MLWAACTDVCFCFITRGRYTVHLENNETDCFRYKANCVEQLAFCERYKVYVAPVITVLSAIYCAPQYVQKAVDGAASAEGISKVDAELTALKHKVAGERIGARYVLRCRVLCRSRTARVGTEM